MHRLTDEELARVRAEAAAEAQRAERAAWADYSENWEATVGSPTLTASRLVALLRESERPFGAVELREKAGQQSQRGER